MSSTTTIGGFDPSAGVNEWLQRLQRENPNATFGGFSQKTAGPLQTASNTYAASVNNALAQNSHQVNTAGIVSAGGVPVSITEPGSVTIRGVNVNPVAKPQSVPQTLGAAPLGRSGQAAGLMTKPQAKTSSNVQAILRRLLAPKGMLPNYSN